MKNKNWKKVEKKYKEQLKELQLELLQKDEKADELQKRNKNLKAMLDNLRLDYYFALTKLGHNCQKPEIENIQVNPEQISNLIQKGLLYKKINEEYCELYNTYRELKSKTKITFDNIFELKKIVED